MKLARPPAVLVMAILNFVFGAFGLMGAVCGIIGLLFSQVMFSALAKLPPPKGGGENPMEALSGMYDDIPGFWWVTTTSMLLTVINGTLLIVCGLGLLKMRPWARTLAIVYAVLATIATIGGVYYAVTYANPGMVKFQQKMAEFQAENARKANQPPPPSFQPSVAQSNAISIGTSVFQLAYPIILLVILYLPHVNAAFAGKWQPRRYRDDEEPPEVEPDLS